MHTLIRSNKNIVLGVPFAAQQLTNLTRIHEDSDLISGLAQWVKDLALLWLWCRSAAVVLTWPLTWALPYATGVAVKKSIYILSLFENPPFHIAKTTTKSLIWVYSEILAAQSVYHEDYNGIWARHLNFSHLPSGCFSILNEMFV